MASDKQQDANVVEKPMHSILVSIESGPKTYKILSAKQEQTLGELKATIQMELQIPPESQEIKFNNQLLNDSSKKLSDYGIVSSTSDKPVIMLNLAVPDQANAVATMFDEDEDEEDDPQELAKKRGEDDDDNDSFVPDRAPGGFVGLKNQGATCYLNSLIQSLFMTPEFRRVIYRCPREWEELLKKRLERIRGNVDQAAESKGENKSQTPTPGATSSDPAAAPKKDEKNDRDIIFEMQLLFARMQMARNSAVSTRPLTRSFGWNNDAVFVQHDIQELARVLTDKLEERMKNLIPEGGMSIPKIYKGSLVNLVKCKNCSRVSVREEAFYDISLVIKGKKNITNSFDEFTAEEILEKENAYFCENCKSKQSAEKSVKFKALPPVLNLHLSRFEYDWNRDVRVKLDDEIGFPLELDAAPWIVNPKVLQDPSGVQTSNTKYELVAVLIHQGTAGFGHYFSYIRNWVDGKWYKFNDESVTEEMDVNRIAWYGERSVYKSTTPYMLVYRQKLAEKVNPIVDNELPVPIFEFLKQENEKLTKIKAELESQKHITTVTVLRNRIELPKKKFKIENKATLKQILNQAIDLVKDEAAGQTFHYRLRRVATRKNKTKRPMNLFKEELDKSIDEMKWAGKLWVYLEQDTDPTFPGLDGGFDNPKPELDPNVLICVRTWSKQFMRPMSVRDVVVAKNSTVLDLKKTLSKYIPIKPEQMLIVEEETQRIFNLYGDDKQPIQKYGVMNGDVLHIEELDAEYHKNLTDSKTFTAKTKEFFSARTGRLMFNVDESEASYKRRTEEKQTLDAIQESENGTQAENKEKEPAKKKPLTREQQKEDYEQNHLKGRIITQNQQTIGEFKDAVGYFFGIDPRRIRIWDRYRTQRLMKNLKKKLVDKFNSKDDKGVNRNFWIEIVNEPEDLSKGDRFHMIRQYKPTSELAGIHEIKVNKNAPLIELKNTIKNKLNIPPERQIISQWWNDAFFRLYHEENETIKNLRILKSDTLRVDEIRDAKLNIREDLPNVAFQFVQYVEWETTSTGRKEMTTTFPTLLTISEEASVWDLRVEIARRQNVQPHNLNIAATTRGFPIEQSSISAINQILNEVTGTEVTQPKKKQQPKDKNAKKDESGTKKPSTPAPADELEEYPDPNESGIDEDEKLKRLCMRENKDGKVFNFKVERKLKLKDIKQFQWKVGTSMSVVCYEDLRKNVPKEKDEVVTTRGQQQKSKRRDSQTLTIM